jgi:hypothetical protein
MLANINDSFAGQSPMEPDGIELSTSCCKASSDRLSALVTYLLKQALDLPRPLRRHLFLKFCHELGQVQRLGCPR